MKIETLSGKQGGVRRQESGVLSPLRRHGGLRHPGLRHPGWALALVLAMLLPFVTACLEDEGVDSYVALVPKTLNAGENTGISVSLFRGETLANANVNLSLQKDGERIFLARQFVPGNLTVGFKVPSLPEGQYDLLLEGNGFNDKAPVQIANSPLIFLQTDKPIYKPGQTIHIRAISLNSELRPVAGKVTVEALDAKGIKVLRKELNTDDFGMASLDLPLSSEPNLGTWKLTANSGKQKTQLDVKVEKYILPKYEIKLDLVKDWYLVNEIIKGDVSSEYSFGKPVAGEVEIKASRYVGRWEQYAAVSKTIDGKTSFEIPAAGYVSGVPGARGMGNVLLDVIVKEKSTGYEEKTNRLVTIASSPLTLQLIPENSVFKPSLPFKVLLLSETPDNQPRDAAVNLIVTYLRQNSQQIRADRSNVATRNGKAMLDLAPPADAAIVRISASSEGAGASISVGASYSPSANFIHLEQTSPGIPKVGEEISFQVYSTKEAANFYYEIVSRGRVVFSDFTRSNAIRFQTTPLMAPSSRLLVYQILPNSELAADSLPFKVTGSYSHNAQIGFNKTEVRPGQEVGIDIKTEGQSKVGLQVVDRSVFILAENRLNLQQVFDELEKLYMKPQVELHSASAIPPIIYRGAMETFADSGLTVLTNKNIPSGEEFKKTLPQRGGVAGEVGPAGPPFLMRDGAVPPPVPRPLAPGAEKQAAAAATPAPGQLAEVQRVRQFFPETWLWQDITTDANGLASLKVNAPDSITIWKLYAVALSREKGLGISESDLKTFQPFFISIDLPYSAIRGETFPVKVAIYNYLNQAQEVFVEIEKAPWLDLLDQATRTVRIAPNDIGGAEFRIRPGNLGVNQVKITARSAQFADAAIKPIIIDPEGVERETVENIILAGGASRTVNTGLPPGIVDGSGRVYLALSGSYLTQSLEGLEKLLQMPFGCGEQNMILLAPNIYVTSYLKETGQLKPEVMAKAEMLMITGYQRELTYRRQDGSFSAFGNNDKEGSLWLTAFVAKSFAQAKDLIYVDPAVIDGAKQWILRHQKADGSFESVGFVAHQDMMGGVTGKDALTAYVAIALLETGDREAAGRAIRYLEGKIDAIDSPYTMAIAAYALELANSGQKDRAYQKLMGMASQDENGLYWSPPMPVPLPMGQAQPGIFPPIRPVPSKTTAIEATAYATLALNKHGDRFNAGRAARWLTSKRNAFGGFGSTQDTVVSLQALTEYARSARLDVDLKITVDMGAEKKELRVNQENAEVLQLVSIPARDQISVKAEGKGDAVLQIVKRYNLPQSPKEESRDFQIKVDYNTSQVAVNDIVKVTSEIQFTPAMPLKAEMVVLDISVPTGFAPVTESIDQAVKGAGKIQRYDIAGRKVIFYIVDMAPGERLGFTFDIRALYPVRAEGVASQVYSYYKPESRGETLGQGLVAVP
ncbi:MAG: alpha-2-macroglobulin [Chloroflexi bacterium]|nr:alpha-2-macroglobulin [Chloroflexota bacterium]